MKINAKKGLLILFILLIIAYLGVEVYRYTQRYEIKKQAVSVLLSKDIPKENKLNQLNQLGIEFGKNLALYSLISLSLDKSSAQPLWLYFNPSAWCGSVQTRIDEIVEWANANPDSEELSGAIDDLLEYIDYRNGYCLRSA